MEVNEFLNQQNQIPKVLIVDDDTSVQHLFSESLKLYGLDFLCASSLKETSAMINQHFFDVIVLDQNLEDGLGTDIMGSIIEKSPFTKIVLLTAEESVAVATNALLNGASDYLLKRSPIEENLKKILKQVSFTEEGSFVFDQSLGIFSKSSSVQALLKKIKKIAPSDSTVLITGESGTGKELFAKALHSCSTRKDKDFMVVNCAAVSEQFLEVEIFGSKKGIFKGSRVDKKGCFEICQNGTLFLNEVGEMSLSLQAKLLRVLKEKEVTPLGACRAIKVNARVFASTNRDLEREVLNGRFREELYHRLSIISICVPSLRERREDLELLTQYFIEKFNKDFGKIIKKPSHEVYAKMRAYFWPGNVRELGNAVERASLLSEDGELSIEHLLRIKKTNVINEEMRSFELDYRQARNTFEKNYITYLLEHTNYSITEAARVSNQYRTNIYRLIKLHNIDIKNKKLKNSK